MKIIIIVILLISASRGFSKSCDCKCLSKDSDGKPITVEGSGVDREAAGINLKKNLHGGKCELSPFCEGKCDLD